MNYSKNDILVTGGAGFLGSHLINSLLEMGQRVTCLDNFVTGSKENLKHLINNKDFSLIEEDVTNPINLNNKVKEIYNLASPASPIKYQLDPVTTILTNVLGAMNTLNLAKKLNIKILQASTSEIYGDPLEHPQKETYFGNINPIGLRSCYDEGKRCAETIFYDYKRQFNINIKIVRIFNTYGPQMSIDDGRVVSNFIIQALKGEDITIYGEGLQTRSFCYVSDLIDGLILMMKSNDQISGPINLGNPDECTIIDLAQKILKITRSDSKIIFKKLPIDDPKKRKPDIELAKKELNWKPSITLDEGLDKTIHFFRKFI